MTVRLVIDFVIPEGLAELYAESSTCEFVGNKEGELTVAEAYAKLQLYAATKTYGAFERVGFMKIYKDGILVGFSMPREIKEKENKVFLLEEGSQWYRIGTVFVGRKHRNNGVMRDTIIEFARIFPNVLWTCNELNIPSRNSALSGRLHFSHKVYVGEERYWEHKPFEGVIRTDLVFKSVL